MKAESQAPSRAVYSGTGAPLGAPQPKRARSAWLIALVIALIFFGLALAATLAWLIFR
jgi:hypothetical protein